MLRAQVPGTFQPTLVLGIPVIQVQGLAFGFVELHEVQMSPPPRLIKAVPLNGNSLLRSVNIIQFKELNYAIYIELNYVIYRCLVDDYPGYFHVRG